MYNRASRHPLICTARGSCVTGCSRNSRCTCELCESSTAGSVASGLLQTHCEPCAHKVQHGAACVHDHTIEYATRLLVKNTATSALRLPVTPLTIRH